MVNGHGIKYGQGTENTEKRLPICTAHLVSWHVRGGDLVD
jgi:hypothetical protein